MGKKRKTPGINGSSSADIAFMLLIFFLITTSMDTDKGLARRLPPPVPKDQKNDTDVDIKKRNLLVVLINSNNQILCGDQFVDIKQLKERIKEFIDNPYNDEHKPERVEADVPFFGKMMVTKNHVISLQNDRGTELRFLRKNSGRISLIWTKNNKKLYSRFIRKRYQKLNLKIMEVKSNGKV